MSIIEKTISIIKNIFNKKDEVKKLPESKIIVDESKKVDFVESLKTATIMKVTKKKIQTPICAGDGLGIQKKITC